MKRILLLVVLSVCFLGLVVGCTQGGQKTATVELEGNPTTGYSWDYTIIPDGVVGEVSNEFVQDNASAGTVGVGGTFVFVFEGVAEGEAEIMFYYTRPWEDVPAEDVAVYKAVVDSNLNIKLQEI